MEKGKDKPDESLNKIKIFFSDDDKLKILGELLSNKSSRDIIRLLIEREMYTNEIAKKLGLQVSLVIHHLRKMESIDLLEITNEELIRKGTKHRYFRIRPGLLILPNKTDENIKHKGILKSILKESVKFSILGITAVSAWFVQKIYNFETSWSSAYASDHNNLLVIPLIIIIIGLLIFLFDKKRKVG